jgi:hypothetical protein
VKPCQCAGPGCFRQAVLVARLAGIGDRPLSRECFDTYVGLGMDIRELGDDVVVPAWRQRSLARDQTGRVLTLRGIA